MKILIIGKNGQLGKSINKIVSKSNSGDDFLFIGRDDLDLANLKSITKYLNNFKFDIVINCAAYTQVDNAENEKKIADQVNWIAIDKIASLLRMTETKLIHISTDYVFNGITSKSNKESDIPNPINHYGKSKLLGELAILKKMPRNAIIIRTSWMYSEFENNFVNTMLRLGRTNDELKVVCDEIGTPTYAHDLAKTIMKIIEGPSFMLLNQKSQIYHFSSLGSCSWFEFANEVFKIANIKCKVLPMHAKDYLSVAKRPKYSVLDKNKISMHFDIHPLNWTQSLGKCIKEIKKNS